MQRRLQVLHATEGSEWTEELKEGDAANDELLNQQILAYEDSQLDSLFIQNRQMFS